MLKSVFQTCYPRQEILSGDLQLDLFAAKLKSVVEGKAPQVYQNPDLFFANLFLPMVLKLSFEKCLPV